MTKYIDNHTILTVVILLVVGALLIAKVDVPDPIWALLAVVSPGLVFKRPDAAKATDASPKLPPPLPLLLLAFLSAGVAASGCGGVPAKPGCGDGDLARINAAEQAELAAECIGYGPECPARAGIHAEYKSKREAWFVRCDSGAT